MYKSVLPRFASINDSWVKGLDDVRLTWLGSLHLRHGMWFKPPDRFSHDSVVFLIDPYSLDDQLPFVIVPPSDLVSSQNEAAQISSYVIDQFHPALYSLLAHQNISNLATQ